MRTRLLFVSAASLVIFAGGVLPQDHVQAGAVRTMLDARDLVDDVCLMPPGMVTGYEQTRGGGAGGRIGEEGPRTSSLAWPLPQTTSKDLMPARAVFDPYPTFGGLALDAAAGRAFFSDSSLSGLLSYHTTAGSDAPTITDPATHVLGPDTGIGFIAGVAVDPQRKEVYAVNNDGGGVVIFGYDQTGMVKPVRGLETPHQSWGISISQSRQEVALSVQQMNAIVFYRIGASELEPPIRTLRGYNTGIADPHGVVYDEQRKELIIANHGNWTELRPYSPYDPLQKIEEEYKPGRFEPAAIRVFTADAGKDAKPLRIITGKSTALDWPMGADVDVDRDEIIVANYGDNSIRFYKRTAEGDVAPSRTIKGPKTGFVGPIDVRVDTVRNELWVANYSDHTALIFDRDAKGDVAPKRTVRNAPKGSAALTFTNAAAAAYDTKRDALIVPNCVSVPKVSIFDRTANGLTAPARVLEGQNTSLSRTMHGVAYDDLHDEITIPVALSGAILVFRGGAEGEEAPVRVIQGSKTRLIRPQTVAVDPVHDEIIVGDTTARAVFVFDRNANGDVAPKRVFYGENTRLLDVVGVAVDPTRDRIVVASRSINTVGILTFDREKAGNVPPKTIISGKNTGLAHFRQVAVDSGSGRVFIAQQSMKEKGLEPYKDDKPRTEEEFKRASRASSGRIGVGFIGVWDINDNGDVPPRVLIQGGMSKLIAPGGIALDPKRGELYAVDGGVSGYFTYIVPQLFKEPWATLSPGTHTEGATRQ